MNFKSSDNHRKNVIWILIGFLLASLLSVTLQPFRNIPLNLGKVWDFSVIEVFCLSISVIISIISLIISSRQLSEVKIAKATFIMELNKSYAENDNFVNLYNKLQACYDKRCELFHNKETDDKCKLDIEKSVVSNYLTFFETIYLLCKSKIISFDVIDDLFAYRFFLAVRSGFVQQQKLLPQPENFRNILKLEKEWLKYRTKEGKELYLQLGKDLETALIEIGKKDKYEELINQ